MNAERGFELHPGAASDITSIWEFIAKDDPLAAKRVREDILDAIRKLVPFPIKATNAEISPHDQCVFRRYAIILSPTHPTKSRSLYSPILDGRRSPRVLATILRERK